MCRIGSTIRAVGWTICLLGCVVSGNDADATLENAAPPCVCRQSGRAAFSSPTPSSSTEDGTVTIRISREPASLISLVEGDPLVSNIMDHTVLEPLVRLTEDGESVEPELAERFEVDQSANRYIFYLNENARWHDGSPVTASDVHFVFSKLIDPYSTLEANSVFANIKEITTPNESTVIFELDHFLPSFLNAVASVPILPAHIFGRTSIALHEAARAPIGSGPFRFVRWIPSRLIELERNPDWRGTPPKINTLIYHIVPDNRIAMDMLRKGELDIVPNLPVTTETVHDKAFVITYPLPFFEAWVYNLRRPFLAEAASRHALAKLIDKKNIQCSLLECLADLPEEILAGDTIHEAIFPTMSFDPEGARQLLESSGWSDSNGDGILDRDGVPFSFSLLLPNLGKTQERAAVVIQEDMARVGIDMRISTVSRGAFFGRLVASRFDVAALAVRFRGHFDSWSLFHTPKGATGNFGGFSDRRVDALLERLRTENDSDARNELISTLRTLLNRLQPMTFTFRPFASALYREEIGGVVFKEGWIDALPLFIKRGNR